MERHGNIKIDNQLYSSHTMIDERETMLFDNQHDGDNYVGAIDDVTPERRSDTFDDRITWSLKVSSVERIKRCKGWNLQIL